MKKLAIASLTFVAVAAFAGASEVVVLKGGKTLELAKPYVIRGNQALMTLKDGTLISVAVADVDARATAAARRAKPAAEAASAEAMSPAEAARAQKGTTKARVKIGDADVAHVLDTGETVPAAADAEAADAEAAARLEVVDFDQRPSGSAIAVKGTIRNSGKTVAENIALTVSALDDSGKTVATTAANVAAGTLDAGSTATFTASIPTAVKGVTLRFTPRWASPAGAVRQAAGAAGAPASGAAAAPAPVAATPAPPPPPPAAETKTTYKPQPDYAPPPANAPMTAPDDNHYGYIPGAHEETPPPPPPPPPPSR